MKVSTQNFTLRKYGNFRRSTQIFLLSILKNFVSITSLPSTFFDMNVPVFNLLSPSLSHPTWHVTSPLKKNWNLKAKTKRRDEIRRRWEDREVWEKVCVHDWENMGGGGVMVGGVKEGLLEWVVCSLWKTLFFEKRDKSTRKKGVLL